MIQKNIYITEMEAALKKIEEYTNILNNLDGCFKPVFNGEIFLTDKELAEKLKVSRRTLQEYRNKSALPFIHLEGKVLYKESDIREILERNYTPAYKENEDLNF